MFLIAGLLFVFPSLLNAVVLPLTGIDIDHPVGWMAGLGWRMGVNVPLGFVLGLLGLALQSLGRRDDSPTVAAGS